MLHDGLGVEICASDMIDGHGPDFVNTRPPTLLSQATCTLPPHATPFTWRMHRGRPGNPDYLHATRTAAATARSSSHGSSGAGPVATTRRLGA
jgi:hypothetical protein